MSRRAALGARVLAAATRAETRASGLREHRVDAGDTTLAVLEGGPADAPAVVLLHGYTADRVVWLRFARHLVRDHRVVVPELAGHGTSGFTSGTDFSAPAQAGRVAAVMDHFGVDRAHVAGNSMGGFVAATLAVAHPERVTSLLLSNAIGVASPEPSEAEVQIQEGGNPFFLHDVADFPDFYAMTMARPPYAPGFVRAAIAADYVARRGDYEEIFTDIFDVATLDDRLGEIAAPTLVMWGEQDRLVHPSTAQVWADGITGARIVRYPDAGHMPMLELPRRTAADYRAFLSRVGRGSDRVHPAGRDVGP